MAIEPYVNWAFRRMDKPDRIDSSRFGSDLDPDPKPWSRIFPNTLAAKDEFIDNYSQLPAHYSPIIFLKVKLSVKQHIEPGENIWRTHGDTLIFEADWGIWRIWIWKREGRNGALPDHSMDYMVYLSHILILHTGVKSLWIHAIWLVSHYWVFHYSFTYCSYTMIIKTAGSTDIHFIFHMKSHWVLAMGYLSSNHIIVKQMEPTTALWLETLCRNSLEYPEPDITGNQIKK